MLAALHLATLDGQASEEVTDLRWAPATHVMEWASNWWVKGPLFVLLTPATASFPSGHATTVIGAAIVLVGRRALPSGITRALRPA
jgi:membrane-associated phospholipid phosphatase